MIHRLIDKEKRKGALVVLGRGGRTLAKSLSSPPELHQMRSSVRRSLKIAIELFVGLLVIGAVLLGIVYHRLEKGPIDLTFMVPKIESAINAQFVGMSVKIGSAFVGKVPQGRGVYFRIRDVVLHNKDGEAIANSPLAAVGLSLEALLWGRIAPSHMVFIEPSLEVMYQEGAGLSLSYTANTAGSAESGFGSALENMLAGMAAPPDGARPDDKLWRVQRVNFMKAVTAAFEEARSHNVTSSYLSQFGVRDASVRFRQNDRVLAWKVPDFVIDMQHNDGGSIIRGFGRLWVGDAAEQIPPWSLRFQAHQLEANKDLRVDVGVRDVTMLSLTRLLPGLAHLQMSDFPISGKLTATMNQDGDLRDSFANIQLSNGSVSVPRLEASAVGFDGSELRLAYSHKGRRVHILPSPLNWGDVRSTLSGVIEPQAGDGKAPIWKFALRMDDARLAAADIGLAPMAIDSWWATGSYSAATDRLSIDAVELRTGTAFVRVSGSIDKASTEPVFALDGEIRDVPLSLLKRLWPELMAPDTREWLVKHMIEGRIASGTVAVNLPASALEAAAEGAGVTEDMVRLDLKLNDIVLNYIDNLLPASVPEAQLTIRGRNLAIATAQGRVELVSGKALRLAAGKLTIDNIFERVPAADMEFRASGTAPAAMEYLAQPTLRYVDKAGFGNLPLEGDLSGSVRLRMPLIKHMQLSDMTVKGDFRLTGLKSGKAFAGSAIEGGSVAISLSERAVGAEGGVVIKGVPAKLNWQRIFGGDEAKQPPLRFSAILSSRERTALGFAPLDRYVAGDVPVVVTIARDAKGEQQVQVRADLTAAKLDLGAVQWGKDPGVPAVLQFDVVQSRGSVSLQDLSLVANEFAIEGEAVFDAKSGSLASFRLPHINYRLINSMEASGQRRADGILAIAVKARSLDGRTMVRPLVVAPGEGSEQPENVVASFDHDLVAEIETMVGDQGTSIRSARIEAKRRKGILEWLDFKGQVDGKALAALRIEREEDGQRYLKAETLDAGSVFRFLGLYPNIEQGQLSLKVELDGTGEKENRGTLWVKNFTLVGTQLVEQEPGKTDPFRDGLAASTSGSSGTDRRGKGKSRILFERLKAPFTYGKGLFRLHDSYANGPVLGATLRGYIDLNREKMNLSGTYVPLYGLNSAVGEIPLLNDLLIGRKGEGVFAVTFAIEGATANPVMMVNPMSLLAPGVFRQIFDFGTDQPAATGRAGTGTKKLQKRTSPPAPVPVIQ